MADRRLRVLASPMAAPEHSNPYTRLLYDALDDEAVEVAEFSRKALLDRPDVVHVHWPDYLVRWDSPGHTYPDVAKVLGLLWLARRRGAALVWSGHDLAAHEALPQPVARWYQRAFVANVDLLISLSGPATRQLRARYPHLVRVPVAEIPHGHYRDVYPTSPSPAEARTALGLPRDATVFLTLGQLKRYKSTPALVQAARATLGASDLLVVAGEPYAPGLADELAAAAGDDPRVLLRLARVPDPELAAWHAASDVVVLAYDQPRSVLHSGAAILALSFNRPVVVADSPSMRELRDRVGGSWVGLHEGTPAAALTVARRLLEVPRSAAAPLDSLDWDGIGSATHAAYVEAAASRAARRSPFRRRSPRA